ncbi:hypothetical protein [Lacinutrix chionoecetis]
MNLSLFKILLVVALPVSIIATTTSELKKDKKNNPKKITICHIPPGNPDNMHLITISVNALQTHLNHGDMICTGIDQ